MPELPEVNRVAHILRRVALNTVVEGVQTTEDTIVYSGGITNLDFEKEIKGRKIIEVDRRGKVFFLRLDGSGMHPVMHLGMTGNVYIRGTNPAFYKSSPKKVDNSWPPRFMKFILKLSPVDAQPALEVVFVDARRLGRIRLCTEPLSEPPISNLGFDPILSMPSAEKFVEDIKKRKCTIKSLLLDQSFSAGIGNWIADEVLFHAGIHPEQKPNLLDRNTLLKLHEKIKYVCETAVSVDADASQFPEGWLFKHRWGKGKNHDSNLILPSGEKAAIKWITVGSRTSAIVPKVQKLFKREAVPSDEGEVERSLGSSAPQQEDSDDPKAKEPTLPVKIIRTKRARKGDESAGAVPSKRHKGETTVNTTSNPNMRSLRGRGGISK